MADKILLFCTFHHYRGGFPKYMNIINVYTFQINQKSGSSALNPGDVFLRFFTEPFFLFLAPTGGEGGSNPTGTTF